MELVKSLFRYLDAKKIAVDIKEFEYNFNSHPDFPSLLALGDTFIFLMLRMQLLGLKQVK